MSQDGSASPNGSASPGEDVKPTVDQTKEVSHITLKFVSQASFNGYTLQKYSAARLYMFCCLQNREDVPIKVKKTTAFEKMFVAYRNKFSLSEGDVRFVVEGERVKPFHTPEHVRTAMSCSLALCRVYRFQKPSFWSQHNLNDGDEVEAVLEMLGGC